MTKQKTLQSVLKRMRKTHYSLQSAGNVAAYIYPNGIDVVEKMKTKDGFSYEAFYRTDYDIPFTNHGNFREWTEEDKREKLVRIVVHNVSILLGGKIERIHFYPSNQSEKLTQKSVLQRTIEIQYVSGMNISFHETAFDNDHNSFFNGDITIQTNHDPHSDWNEEKIDEYRLPLNSFSKNVISCLP